MDFYYGRLSGNSARCAFALAETGASYDGHLIDTRAGENRANPYLALNPMGKIPAFVDGPLTLWESNAINWYLAETHPQAHLLPATASGRASVQRWLFFQAAHVGLGRIDNGEFGLQIAGGVIHFLLGDAVGFDQFLVARRGNLGKIGIADLGTLQLFQKATDQVGNYDTSGIKEVETLQQQSVTVTS